MKPPPTPAPGTPPADNPAAQLAGDLAALRDALVTLSLSLKDWLYELDRQGAQQTQALADQALHTARHAGAEAHSPSPSEGQ